MIIEQSKRSPLSLAWEFTCLANLALDGLEETILSIGKQKDKLNFVRYADD